MKLYLATARLNAVCLFLVKSSLRLAWYTAPKGDNVSKDSQHWNSSLIQGQHAMKTNVHIHPHTPNECIYAYTISLVQWRHCALQNPAFTRNLVWKDCHVDAPSKCWSIFLEAACADPWSVCMQYKRLPRPDSTVSIWSSTWRPQDLMLYVSFS